MAKGVVCIEESCRIYGERQNSTPSSPCKSCGGPTFNYDAVYESTSDDGPGERDFDSLQQEFLFYGERKSKKKRGGEKRQFSNGYSPNPLALASQSFSTHTFSDEFSCPPDLTSCPVAAAPTVTVPYELFQKWIYMAKGLTTEWIAFLKGSEPSPGQYLIEDMYIPLQRATGSFCEAEDGQILPGTIGAVHSHVGMNVFFSDTDVKHMNHAIELVVNNKGEIIANGRTKLDCGRYHRRTAKVYLSGAPTNDPLMQELKSKVQPMGTQGPGSVAQGSDVWERTGPNSNSGLGYPGYHGKTGNGYFKGF